jgi:hypothetical protein
MIKMNKLVRITSGAVVAGALGFASWAAAQVKEKGCARDANMASLVIVGHNILRLCSDGSGGAQVTLDSDAGSNGYTVVSNLTAAVNAGHNSRGEITPQSGTPTCIAVDSNPSTASKTQVSCTLPDGNPAVTFSVRVGDGLGDPE